MTEEATKPRPWKIVAAEQRYNLRLLGEHVGRRHTTMWSYSTGKRPVPKDVLEKLSQLFGEPVQ